MASHEPQQRTDLTAWLSTTPNSTGYLFIKLGEVAAGGASQMLAPLGLRTRHVHILATLATDDSLSQQDVSRRLGIDPNVLVGILDELEKQGQVERRRNPRDRRRHLLILTPTGRDVLRKAVALLQEADKALCATMSPEELGVVRTVAQRLIDANRHLIRG